MGRLEGKVAIGTGGASGMGASHCAHFAKQGATVILADRDRAAAEATAESLTHNSPGKAIFVPLDVGSKEQWTAAIGHVEATYGRLDVLVNNAGIIRLGSTEELSVEDREAVFAVNVRGVFLGSQAAIPLILSKGQPVSVAARMPTDGC